MTESFTTATTRSTESAVPGLRVRRRGAGLDAAGADGAGAGAAAGGPPGWAGAGAAGFGAGVAPAGGWAAASAIHDDPEGAATPAVIARPAITSALQARNRTELIPGWTGAGPAPLSVVVIRRGCG